MDSQKNIAVYTCITGGYERLRHTPVHNGGLTKYCFSNDTDKLPSGWTKRPLQSPDSLIGDPHKINRYHKLFPYLLFPKHRYSIYMDGNIEYTDSYEKLLEGFITSGAAVGAFRHPRKHKLVDEPVVCWKYNKLDDCGRARAEEQIQKYQERGFDASKVISTNFFLIRDHMHPRLAEAMNFWWQEIAYTKRDQISLNFSLWFYKVPFIFLDDLEDIQSTSIKVYRHKTEILKGIQKEFKILIKSARLMFFK